MFLEEVVVFCRTFPGFVIRTKSGARDDKVKVNAFPELEKTRTEMVQKERLQLFRNCECFGVFERRRRCEGSRNEVERATSKDSEVEAGRVSLEVNAIEDLCKPSKSCCELGKVKYSDTFEVFRG